MLLSVLKMAETTIGLLAFCIMGVMGGISDVDVTSHYIQARTPWTINVALPPVAYVSDWQSGARETMRHETGHLIQADRLHGFYYPVIGVASVLWITLGDWDSLDEYRAFWAEDWADAEAGL